LVRGGWSEAERQQKRKELLDYCGMDTMAMVRLVDRLLLPPPFTSQIESPHAPTR